MRSVAKDEYGQFFRIHGVFLPHCVRTKVVLGGDSAMVWNTYVGGRKRVTFATTPGAQSPAPRTSQVASQALCAGVFRFDRSPDLADRATAAMSLSDVILGRPLASKEAEKEELTVVTGVPVWGWTRWRRRLTDLRPR